jgi:hypothetical protein
MTQPYDENYVHRDGFHAWIYLRNSEPDNPQWANIDPGKIEEVAPHEWDLELVDEGPRPCMTDLDPREMCSSTLFVPLGHFVLGLMPYRHKVTHLNGNTLDNRVCNLLAEKYPPLQLKPSTRATTSAHKGVYWYKRLEKWAARVTHRGKRVSLGYFDTEDEAAAACRKARVAISDRADLGKFADSTVAQS